MGGGCSMPARRNRNRIARCGIPMEDVRRTACPSEEQRGRIFLEQLLLKNSVRRNTSEDRHLHLLIWSMRMAIRYGCGHSWYDLQFGFRMFFFFFLQHAIAYVEGDKYYGAKATINVWKPKIQQSNEFSLSQIWILGGSFGQDLNSIEGGWQVSPDLYGDNNTRLFTYWTVSN